MVHIFFLWIPKPDLAIGRIRERVREGGHDVPSVDVRRRFLRSIENFFNIYEPLAATWMLFNNSQAKPSLIAEKQAGIIKMHDKEQFLKIQVSARR